MSVNRVYPTYLALGSGVEEKVVQLLIPLLADTIFIQNLYKKYALHVEGDDYFQYSPLFSKHAEEQSALVDLLAKRIRILGADAPMMPADIQSQKTIDEPSDAGHDDEAMIRSACAVHEGFLKNLRPAIEQAAKLGDLGTSNLLVNKVLKLHESELLIVRSSLDL